MENLENYGVQELNAKEMEDFNGGNIFIRWLLNLYETLEAIELPQNPYVDYAEPDPDAPNYA